MELPLEWLTLITMKYFNQMNQLKYMYAKAGLIVRIRKYIKSPIRIDFT